MTAEVEVKNAIDRIHKGDSALPRSITRRHLVEAISQLLKHKDQLERKVEMLEMKLQIEESEDATDKTSDETSDETSCSDSDEGHVCEDLNECPCTKGHYFRWQKKLQSEELTSQAEEEENEKVTKISENSISAENVTKGLLDQNTRQKVVCKFYKAGCCRFKTNCKYDHPKTCEAFDNFGYKEGGCRQNNCQSGLHLNVCKFFMRGKCKKEDCKWFHPKRLMQYKSDHNSVNNLMAQALSEISKILSLLMQEHNKDHTGEKARGSP